MRKVPIPVETKKKVTLRTFEGDPALFDGVGKAHEVVVARTNSEVS